MRLWKPYDCLVKYYTCVVSAKTWSMGQWDNYPRLCSDLMKPIRRAVTQEAGEIATACVQLKHRLGELGLFCTMQEMEKVVTAVGYEFAEKICLDK